MQTNLVPIDRAIRLGGGLLLLASPILELHTFPFNLLGIIPIATSIAGFCPLYALRRWLPKLGAAHSPSNTPRPLAR